MYSVQYTVYSVQCTITYTWNQSTKYVHIKSTTVYAPRRNWDSPQPPTRRLVCPLPPVSGGRGTLAGEKGVGRVPIQTRGIHCGTLYMYVLCEPEYLCVEHGKRMGNEDCAFLLSLKMAPPYQSSHPLLANIFKQSYTERRKTKR